MADRMPQAEGVSLCKVTLVHRNTVIHLCLYDAKNTRSQQAHRRGYAAQKNASLSCDTIEGTF
jgi:hypothetical protein